MSAKFSQPLRTCVGEGEAGVCESGASATVIDLCDDSSDGALPCTALAIQDIADVPAAAHSTPAGSDGADFAPGVLFPEGLDWSPVRLPRGLELSELRLPYIPAPKCRCEYLAAEAIRDRYVTFELLMYLAKNLPKAKMRAIATGNGASVRSKQQASFYGGAFTRGGIHGLYATMRTHPWCTLLLSTFICSCARLPFTIFGLRLNVEHAMHVDKGNAAGSLNFLVPCSSFVGGGLWLENSEGAVVSNGIRGEVLPLQLPGVVFNPLVRHQTCAWEGDRLVIAAYCARQVEQLNVGELRRLLSFHFHTASCE